MPSFFKSLLLIGLALSSMAQGEELTVDPWHRLHRKLSIVTSLHLTDVPLNQALALLGRQVGVQFAIDQKALRRLGPKPRREGLDIGQRHPT